MRAGEAKTEMSEQPEAQLDCHLLEQGSGPPVLFLHGNPDSSEIWRDVIDPLSRRFRCLAPDLPGFGRTPAPESFDCSLDSMSCWVNSLLDKLAPGENVHLVGHDFGAIFAMAFAIRNPGRIGHIAVGGFPFFPDYRWHFWGRVWRTPILGEISMLSMNRWLFAREMRAGGPKLGDDHVERAYRFLTGPTKRLILRLYRATDPGNFAAWQSGLEALLARKPTLVLWGEKDPFVPADYTERFPGARIVRFPDCGHWFPAEEAEAVAALLKEFLPLSMPEPEHRT